MENKGPHFPDGPIKRASVVRQSLDTKPSFLGESLRLQDDHSGLQREREAFEEEKALALALYGVDLPSWRIYKGPELG